MPKLPKLKKIKYGILHRPVNDTRAILEVEALAKDKIIGMMQIGDTDRYVVVRHEVNKSTLKKLAKHLLEEFGESRA